MAAALAWWREAGVDHAYHDEPQPWLRDEPPPRTEARAPIAAPAPAEAAPLARIGGDPAAAPADLDAFVQWWLAEPSLDHGMVRARVPPRGTMRAPLMILVAEPEPEDEGSGTLLSGPNGRLLDAFLAAAGLADLPVWRASALVRHTPLADWTELARSGLGDVLARHLALARPRRLIVFGRNLPPLLDHDPTQIAADLRLVNQETASIPTLFAPDLGHLARRPGAKAAFWRNWLDWSAKAGS
jgi:DNA polymerase